jgi:hypothetical protein
LPPSNRNRGPGQVLFCLILLTMLIAVAACGSSNTSAPLPYARITGMHAAPDPRSSGWPYWTETWYNVRVTFTYADGHSGSGVANWSVLTPEIVEVEDPCGSNPCSYVRVFGLQEGRASIVASWSNSYGSWVDTAYIRFVVQDSTNTPPT